MQKNSSLLESWARCLQSLEKANYYRIKYFNLLIHWFPAQLGNEQFRSYGTRLLNLPNYQKTKKEQNVSELDDGNDLNESENRKEEPPLNIDYTFTRNLFVQFQEKKQSRLPQANFFKPDVDSLVNQILNSYPYLEYILSKFKNQKSEKKFRAPDHMNEEVAFVFDLLRKRYPLRAERRSQKPAIYSSQHETLDARFFLSYMGEEVAILFDCESDIHWRRKGALKTGYSSHAKLQDAQLFYHTSGVDIMHPSWFLHPNEVSSTRVYL